MTHTKRLYFAHPINLYGTDLESEIISDLSGVFPKWEIVNPGEPKHEAGYRR